ncbi:MAG: phosphoribosylanthranilate isomerase [Bacteroidota bacterium]
MKWKVCGMRQGDNIEELLAVGPDFMGLIFYPHSKRYVTELAEGTRAHLASTATQIVGVFVNERLEVILEKVAQYHLDYVQLHGDEPVELGVALQSRSVKVIKVFRIADELPSEALSEWEEAADLFLFDTKTDQYGGSGRHFDWGLLRAYAGTKPYLLSGGIGPDDLGTIANLKLQGLAGVDVNSGYEVAPGVKNIQLIREMKEVIC